MPDAAKHAILAAAAAGLAGGVGYAALGPTLGLFAWGFFAATILIPPLSLLGSNFAGQAAAVGGAVGMLLLMFTVAAVESGEAAALPGLALLLSTFAAAEWGLTALARRLHIPPTCAAALATAVGLAWLTWPVWGSTLPAAGRIADFHPLLAANGLITPLGVWTERPLAYRLTALGQDVPYRLPSPAAASVVQGVIGVSAVALSRAKRLITRATPDVTS